MDVLHESAARAFVSLRQPLGTWARVRAWFRAIP
jgi:hypothetical protein